MSTHDARTPLISNRDGQVVHDGREVLKRIVTQVSNPVRWDLCMETMLDLGVTGMLEMPPAGTLTGIAKRAMKGVETFALKTPDQLDDARAFIDKHGDASQIDTNPTWRMLVAPAKGTFHQTADLPEGGAIAPDTAIGAVAEPPGRDRRDRAVRRHDRGVARRGRRPGLPRPAADPPAPRRSHRMTAPSTPSDRRPRTPRILGHRHLPPQPGGPERRARRGDRLQRRVDPAALRHQGAPLRRRPTRPCR